MDIVDFCSRHITDTVLLLLSPYITARGEEEKGMGRGKEEKGGEMRE